MDPAYHITQAAETLLAGILATATGLSGVPVRRAVDDDLKTRPIVVVSGDYHETLIPDGMFSVARVNLRVVIETQFDQETRAQHDGFIIAVHTGIPNYGLYTPAQPYFERVYFGPTTAAGETVNDLIRTYAIETYLVGRLTLPA